MTTITPLAPDVVERAKALADEGHDLTARKAALEARLQDIRHELASLLPRGSYTDLGVEVKPPNRKFAFDRAKAAIPPEVWALIVEEKVAAKRARQILGDDVYEAFMDPGEGEGTVAFK